MEATAVLRVVQIGALWAVLLLAAPGRAEEPTGFQGRAWGTPWTDAAISSLPGCEGQGDLVTDVDGYVARVAQPECVGYRLSERQRVNVILLYPDIKWHSLEHSRVAVHNLLSLRRMWGLSRAVTARLEELSPGLARLVALRRLFGGDGPVFRYPTDSFSVPAGVQGLQGYQVNFPPDQYDTMRSALLGQLGPPTRGADESPDAATRSHANGEVLEWTGSRTLAILKQRGSIGTSGHFVVLTRAYVRLLTEQENGSADPPRGSGHGSLPRPNAISQPWFLQIFVSFDWAVNFDGATSGSLSGSR